MSAEHHQEHNESHERSNDELESARREKFEEMHNKIESDPDDAEKRAEVARQVINKPEQSPEPPPAAEAAPPARHSIPLLGHQLNYAQTLASVQRRLKPASRRFSKVIHAPAVEKTSEVLERTLARPSVTAGATWTALIVGAVFYFTARSYGYALSGSEIDLSFLVGAAVGIGLEGVWRTFARRH